MRALKVVLTALFAVLALLAGLVLTALVAAGSIVLLGLRRLLGGSPSTPAHAAAPRPSVSSAAGPSDIIEVTATEVHPEPPAR